MQQGKLLEGEKLLFRGRDESVFGNEPPKSPMPMWDGKSKGTVLLNLEGGLGDQIHGVRYARDIAKIAGEVIVACSGALATLFRDVEGVVAVCQSDAVYGVVHDYWAPSMSTIPILGYEYKDISGKPYINKPLVEPHKGLRIGLRWQGPDLGRYLYLSFESQENLCICLNNSIILSMPEASFWKIHWPVWFRTTMKVFHLSATSPSS